jgi:hypothetical protein
VRECRAIPVYSSLLVRFYHYKARTRPRVQRAPGIPYALLGRTIHQRLGRIAPRGRERMFGIEMSTQTHSSCQGLIRASINLRMIIFEEDGLPA